MSETLTAPARLAVEIRHSRFLALAAPVDDAAQALAWLACVHDASASHHCWAYRIGNDHRSSDDGEPGGSAGRPILAAIDGQAVDAVMVVVLRWFGGTRLGVGGLVRAYGGTAAECLRLAPRRPLVRYARLTVRSPFADIAAVHAAIAVHGCRKHGEAFAADGVHVALAVPVEHVAALEAQLRDASRGRIAVDAADADHPPAR